MINLTPPHALILKADFFEFARDRLSSPLLPPTTPRSSSLLSHPSAPSSSLLRVARSSDTPHRFHVIVLSLVGNSVSERMLSGNSSWSPIPKYLHRLCLFCLHFSSRSSILWTNLASEEKCFGLVGKSSRKPTNLQKRKKKYARLATMQIQRTLRGRDGVYTNRL